jgi:CHAT domain-containing protein/Flp pilus assembly protein TadD
MNIKIFLLAIALLLLSSERVKANDLLLELNLKPLSSESGFRPPSPPILGGKRVFLGLKSLPPLISPKFGGNQSFPPQNWGGVVKGRGFSGLPKSINVVYSIENCCEISAYRQDKERAIANPVLAQNSPEAEQLFNQGTTQYQNNQIEAAIETWQKALTLYRQQQDFSGESLTLGRMGLAYEALEDYPQAVDYFEQTLAIAKKIDNIQLEASILGNLGNNYLRLSNYPRAIEAYQQSLTLWRQLGDRAAEGQVLRGLGNVQIALGNYDKALDFHQQSLAITRSFNDREGLIYSYNSLGAISANQGNYQQASQYYQQSLDTIAHLDNSNLAPKLTAQALNNLGSTAHAQMNYPQALDYYQQSLAIAQNHNLSALKGIILSGMGSVYLSLDDYARAKEYLQQGLTIARQIGDRVLEAESLHNFGYAEWKLNRLSEAENSFRSAIALREKMREGLSDLDRVSLIDTQLQSYPLLRRVLVAQTKYEAALEIAEAERARAFVQLLATRLSTNTASAEALQQQTTPPTSEQIRQIARQQNATLVEYAFIADENFVAQGKLHGEYKQIYIWVVKPTGEVIFRLVELTPQQADLIVKAGNWANNWQNRATTLEEDELKTQFSQLHRSLYPILIEPIAAELPDSPESPVIFIPQGELFQISFPALQDNNGTYLIERHSILTIPAIQVLQFTRQQRQNLTDSNNDRALVVGNPVMPKTISIPGESEIVLDLVPLPGAEREARSIAEILNTSTTIGQAATETAIARQISSASLVHFATHGLLDDFTKSGIPGAIALAPGEDNDGVLTANEILDLQLNAKLVVISACDTGRGLLTRDGVVGLSRSLLAAGTSSVVIALWEIYDDSTAELMNEFYRQLAQKQPLAQALRLAMLKTKQQFSHPINWGAFTLIGEAK